MSSLGGPTQTHDFAAFSSSRPDQVLPETVRFQPRDGPVKVLILTDAPLVGWGVQTSLAGWENLSVAIRSPQENALGAVLAEEGPEVVVVATSRVVPGMCRHLRAAQQRGGIGALACLSTTGVGCREQSGHLTLPLAEATPTAVRALLQRALEVARPQAAAGAPPSRGALTEREKELGRLVASGHSSQELARQLFISPRTVEKHRANVMDKLGVANAAALTLALVYLLWGEMAERFEWPAPLEAPRPVPASRPLARQVA